MAGFPTFNKFTFDYFDGVVIGWLIVGVFVGRKRGMTRELLPTIQWVSILLTAGFCYRPVGDLIFQTLTGAFTRMWSNVTAYLLIAFGIHLFFLWLKQNLSDKVEGSDSFGRGEYYMGMMAGMLRSACMLIVLLAIMHSRVYSAGELAEDDKMQNKNFEGIRFPTYMSVQHSMMAESFTGQMVCRGLRPVLIVATPGKHVATAAKTDPITAYLGNTK